MTRGVDKELRKALAKDHACFVLITCSEPSDHGQMQVEMTYEGDPTLAAYLLHSAQSYLDDIDIDDDSTGSMFDDESRYIN